MTQLYLYVVNKILIFNIVASSYHKDNGLKMQVEGKGEETVKHILIFKQQAFSLGTVLKLR